MSGLAILVLKAPKWADLEGCSRYAEGFLLCVASLKSHPPSGLQWVNVSIKKPPK